MGRTTRTGAMALPSAIAAAIVLAGCGATAASRTDPRPPAPIVLTASISDQRVSVSPRSFGAGPISLIVTNQTNAAQRVTLESVDAAGQGPGLEQETAPISPRDTATLKADVDPGRYRVHVVGDAIAAAALRVGPERKSAQNDLLQP
ncbi:MAG: hypothetical protein V7607_4041 [Solirubrobacteraceae bacterium]